MSAMECSPSHQSPSNSDDDDGEIEDLSQQMSQSLQGSSQRSKNGGSQNRDGTPEVPKLPDRLQSIPLSDSGVFCGPEDDPELESNGQGPPSSQHSLPSQNSEHRSDGAGNPERTSGNASATSSYYANRAVPNSIYDSQRYPFPLRRFWHPERLLVCADGHRGFLYSQAKCMGLTLNKEKQESYGVTWSFVFPFTGFGLPEGMIKAIHFFTTIESLSTHNKWNKYTMQTKNLRRNLYPNYNDKDIIGVMEGTCTDDADSGSESEHTAVSADLNDLLKSSEGNSSGIVFKALPLLRMNIGVTGALYNVGGREKRQLFGILYVHWLLNVDFMQLMMKTLLAVPSAKATNFDNVNKARNALFDTFISLLVTQTLGITGDLAGQSPRDYLENPNGRLGAHNLCNPFWEPFKILKSLEEGASDVKIIGYPNIDWQGDPNNQTEGNDLRNYILYANGYAGHVVDWCSKIQQACALHSGAKNSSNDKPSRKKRRETASVGVEDGSDGGAEVSLPVFYGFPMRLDSRSQYFTCVSSYAPIFLEVRYLRVPNARDAYVHFQINFGGIPMILQCLFRTFLFHGRAGVDAAKLDKIYLEGLDVKWNIAMLEDRYYGVNGSKSLQFAFSGCHMKSYHDLVSYIRDGIEDGSVSPHNAIQVLTRHWELCWGLYVSMVDSGSFMSDRVVQTLRMLKKSYAVNQNGDVPFLRTLHDFQSRILSHTPVDFIINPYDFAKRVILYSLVHTNNAGQLLNSINLGTKFDLIISMIAYSMGHHNKTLTPFGKGIEVAPCNGSAREIIPGSKGVSAIKIDNPNGCGKDFSVIKLNDDLDLLARLLKESGSKLLKIAIMNGFTKTSILLETCLQVVGGRVISTPDPSTNGQPCASTEVRGNLKEELDTLVGCVWQRGEEANQLRTTTKENQLDHSRETVLREKVFDVHLLLRCTNTEISNKDMLEVYKTAVAVLHFRPSGASLYNPGDPDGKDMASAYVNRFECRSRRLSKEDEEISAFVHAAVMLAAEHVGRMNQTMFPAEINPVVSGVMDWLLYVTQVNWESMFNNMCNGRRLNRLKRVYEARSAAMGLYAHTMENIIKYDDYNEAIHKAAMAFHSDALPLTNCGDLLYSMIFRCLSWVPIVYSRCYALETNVPVVPVETLISLLTSEDGVPAHGTEMRFWYDQVSSWLEQCVDQHRFCINPEGDSFSEYISSSGTIVGGVSEDGVLRVGKDQNGWMDTDSLTVPRLLAEHAWKKYGKELEHSFALSESSLAVCIDEMLKTFEVGGRKLLGIDVGDISRHVEYFGLAGQLPFRGRRFSNEKKPYAIQHVWSKDDTRDPKAAHSVGIGLHWVQLLLLTSLTGDSIGTSIHPQLISDLARTLVRLVLEETPAGVTPTRLVEVASFNCHDCSLEPIDMGDKKRPEHFLRAQNEQLAIDGILPDCPNFQNFAVEDLLAVGALCGWAKCLGCKVWDVPAIAGAGYNLRTDVVYVIYNQTTGSIGMLEITKEGVVTMEYDNSVGKSLNLESWQTELTEQGFIVLPLITRPGACVTIGDEGRVGCLVPHDEFSSLNISREDQCYSAKVHIDTVQKMPALEVMEKLLPIGTMCYLKMESQSAAPLLRRLNSPLSSDERMVRVLRVRLSSPNVKKPIQGKLYMVFVVRRGVVATSETIMVDPWEITTVKGRRFEIEHLSS